MFSFSSFECSRSPSDLVCQFLLQTHMWSFQNILVHHILSDTLRLSNPARRQSKTNHKSICKHSVTQVCLRSPSPGAPCLGPDSNHMPVLSPNATVLPLGRILWQASTARGSSTNITHSLKPKIFMSGGTGKKCTLAVSRNVLRNPPQDN